MDGPSSEAVVHTSIPSDSECVDVGGDFRFPLFDGLGSRANAIIPNQLTSKFLFASVHCVLGLVDQYHQHRCLYAQELEGDWHQGNGI